MSQFGHKLVSNIVSMFYVKHKSQMIQGLVQCVQYLPLFSGPIQLVLTSHQFFSMFVHNNMAKTLCKHKKLGFSLLLGWKRTSWKRKGGRRWTSDPAFFLKKSERSSFKRIVKPWAEYRWHSGSGENIKSLTSKV